MKTKRSFYIKTLFYSLAAVIIIFGSSRSFGYEWSKTFGGTGRDEGHSVQQTCDGGYIIAGEVNKDIYLIKTDVDGNELWSKILDESRYFDRANSVQQTTDGGYIIAGIYLFDPEYWGLLIKTDTNGNKQWSKIFSNYYGFSSVQQTTDGGYIIASTARVPGHWGKGLVLLKTDANGNEQWSKIWGGDLMMMDILQGRPPMADIYFLEKPIPLLQV